MCIICGFETIEVMKAVIHPTNLVLRIFQGEEVNHYHEGVVPKWSEFTKARGSE